MSYEAQHYPTPEQWIDYLVAPYGHEFPHDGRVYRSLPKIDRILEPSAGQGAMADRLVDHWRVRKDRLFCIEIDAELQYVLQGKGYKLIDADFLNYQGEYAVDMIVMNPPFAQGAAHLLHAWRISRGGPIACYLNAKTLTNPHTKERQLIQRLIQRHGRVEMLGPIFQDAERPTGVEVAAVWLEKPQARPAHIDLNGRAWDRDTAVDAEAFSANPLAHFNIFESLVSQYEAAVRVLVARAELDSAYLYYTSAVTSVDFEKGQAPGKLNEDIADLKKKFWRYLFDKTKFGRVTTSRLQKKVGEFTDNS